MFKNNCISADKKHTVLITNIHTVCSKCGLVLDNRPLVFEKWRYRRTEKNGFICDNIDNKII